MGGGLEYNLKQDHRGKYPSAPYLPSPFLVVPLPSYLVVFPTYFFSKGRPMLLHSISSPIKISIMFSATLEVSEFGYKEMTSLQIITKGME